MFVSLRLSAGLALAGLAPSLATSPIQAPPALEEAGALAPAGRWTVRGGSLARTGAALTRAARGWLHPAWTVELEGLIEGEPLVWDQRVLVVERRAGEALLRGFDLTTGRELVQPYRVPGELELG